MWDSVGSWGTANEATKSPYVIPTDGNTIVHVNASDLENGTADIGPIWTMEGTVPLAAANPAVSPYRPGVGPFSSSNFFSQGGGGGSILGINGDFTFVMLISTPASQNGFPQFINIWDGSTTGCWLLQAASGTPDMKFIPPQFDFEQGDISALGLHIIIGGRAADAGFLAIDGNSPREQGGYSTATGSPGVASQLGYNFSGNAHLGLIYELMVSTDTPTSGLATSLYNSIIANI